MQEQLKVAGVGAVVGDANIYTSDEWVGTTIKRALDDAEALIVSKAGSAESGSERASGSDAAGARPNEDGATE